MGKAKKLNSLRKKYFGFFGNDNTEEERTIGFKYGKNQGSYGSSGGPRYDNWDSGFDLWKGWFKKRNHELITPVLSKQHLVYKSYMDSLDYSRIKKCAVNTSNGQNSSIVNLLVDNQKTLESTGIASFMIEDILNMFYSENEFRDITVANKWWKNCLDKIDDYLLKDLTKGNAFFTGIILKNILEQAGKRTKDEQNAFQNGNQACQDHSNHQKNKHQQQQKQQQSQNNKSNSGNNQQNQNNQSENDQSQNQNQGQDQSDKGELGNQQNSSTQNESGKGEGSAAMPQYIPDFRENLAPNLKKLLNKHIQRTQQFFENAINKSIQEIAEKSAALKKLGLSAEDLKKDEIIESLKLIDSLAKSINLNKGDLFKFISTTLKGAKKAITGNPNTFEEDFFDSDVIEDLDDFANLSHVAMYQELAVIDSDPTCKFDVYIDRSGSMSSGCSIEGVSRMNAAKAIVIKMRAMGLLNNVYYYDGRVHNGFSAKNLGSILRVTSGGGTTGDNCIEQINNTNIPSLIITDGDDHLDLYSKNAYVMCIEQSIGLNRRLWNGTKQVVLFRKGKFEYLC